MSRKTMNILGLAQRAGKVVSGGYRVREAIKMGKAKLLIMAEDSASHTARELSGLCNTYGVPVIKLGLKSDLGGAIGKSDRASVVIQDEQISSKIRELQERGDF